MSDIIFNGWTRDYLVKNAERYKRAVDDLLVSQTAIINDKLCMGASISHLISSMRDRGFKMPGLEVDCVTMLEALGYRVVKGKVGKNTRGGYKHCSPANVVTL